MRPSIIAQICDSNRRPQPSIASRSFMAAAGVAALVLGIVSVQAQTAPAMKNATGFVYTADEGGNTISTINLATGEVAINPATFSPHNVQVTVDGARLLAVGVAPMAAGAQGHGASETGMKAPGQLLVFSTASMGSGPTASLIVGDHPAHVIVESTGKRAFVTLSGENVVAVIDLARNVVVRKISTGRFPHGLRISPDGRSVYVANVEDGSVSVIDTATLSQVATIAVGKGPVQVGFTPDGAEVYVSLRDENKVAVIDTKTKAVLARIDVGRNPIQVHATRDGRFVYAANQGTDAEPADTVSVIDTETKKVVATIQTGAGAHGVTISTDGQFVFVTNIVAGTVSAIDAKSRAVVATFTVGRGPNGITYTP